MLLDDPGRVRSQKTSVVCQIQRFDFDCNLVVTRKVIIRIPPVLGTNPLYGTDVRLKSVRSTKGDQLKIGYVDRISRETLE